MVKHFLSYQPSASSQPTKMAAEWLEGRRMRTPHFSRFLLMTVALLALSAAAFAQIGVAVAVSFGPPELPVYEQPVCPEEGYIWTPGFWAWDGDDYYWVPGTWVPAPEAGFLWTPGYWDWQDTAFFFHDGYWGPQVGFYGGINYGFGYFGHGYEGGRWDNGRFFYNRAVNNVNVTVIHNVYNTTVINNNRTETRVSFHGGNGGVNERPTAEEQAAARARHIPPVAVQTQHVQAARSNPELRASTNHGKPPIAATPKPAAFNDRGVVPAREGGRYNPPPNRSGTNRAENNTTRPANPIHANEIPPTTRNTPNSTGNPNLDRKYQQQQEKLNARQDQERAKLQQKQEQDHQRIANQQANDARKQQVEQQHQQQTQQLMQRHVQQQQQLQQHQQPPHQPPPPQHENPPPKH
jgi:hypothetical protein